MKALALASCLVAPLVLADVGMRQGGAYVGPVRDIDCAADGGLSCTRDAGVAIARLRCIGATATEPGCITPGAQTFAGAKTWTGRQRIVGTTHAMLTACSSGLKGTWQTCTTHNKPVFCNGTSNIELGSEAPEQILDSVHVNGIPAGVMGGAQLGTAWAVSAVNAFWLAGEGSGQTLDVHLLTAADAGTCVCPVSCDAPTPRTECTGACSFAVGDFVAYLVLELSTGGGGVGLASSYVPGGPSVVTRTSSCSKDPAVVGDLTILGTHQ